MSRAYGTLSEVRSFINGLKSVVTKWFEPTALRSIKQHVMITEKISQPFYTAKPTGQGTRLGLSLSYDIVKAHGGELKVETKEGRVVSLLFCCLCNQALQRRSLD